MDLSAVLARGMTLLRRSAATPSLRLGLFAIIALCASWRPLGEAGRLNEFRDSHLVHTYEEVAVRTVLEYGELPLWNPWSCGGMYALGNPQTRFASPAFAVSLALGARRGEPVLLFLFLLLGMEGMFRFIRLRSAGVLAAFVCAPFFALTGYGAIAWTLGWMSFLGGFLLIPWALYGTARLARGEAVGAVPLMLSTFTMLGLGGSYPLALAAVFSALEAIRGLVERRRRRALLWGAGLLVVAGLLVLGALAVRLWPVVETLDASPRVMAGRPGHSLQTLLMMMLGPAHGAKGTEAIFALSPVAFVFALAALMRWRRALAPLLLFAFAVWCASGYAGASPFVWLRELPLFEALRYPERFLYPAAAYLAEAAAVGVGAALELARRRLGRPMPATAAVAGVLVLCAAGWVYGVVEFEYLARRSQLGPMPARVDQPFKQARGNRWIAGHVLALNRGSIACGEAYPVWMSPALRGDLPAEEYLLDPSRGEVRRAHWSPNRLVLEARLAREAVVRVNQNWHPGWRASVGEVLSSDGLLAVSLPPGDHQVELWFRPRSAWGGALVSALAWLALGAWLWAGRRWPRWTVATGAGLGALPLLVWGILAGASPEAAAPPRILNQDGTPILVAGDAAPPGAQATDVRFELPLELAAARVPSSPNEHGEVPLVLYWKVVGDVPRTVGVFVHIVGPGGKRHSSDHEVVGGTFFFEDAPRGVLLRDAFRVNTSDWEKGEWVVHVGLWHASGDGSRVPVRNGEGQALEGSNAVVGRFEVK